MKALSRLAAVGLAVGVGVSVAQPVPMPAPVIPASATDPLLRPEPAVALDWTGPAVVRLGKPNAYTLTVKNTSRGFVQQVTVQVRPPDGAAVSDPKPAARVVDGVYLWDVGTLEPGEAKPLTITLTTTRRGDLACQAWVTLTGTAGMTVKVQEPKLEARIDAPLRAVVGEPFKVGYKVTNGGDSRVAGVTTGRTGPGLNEAFRASVKTTGVHIITRDNLDLPPLTPPAADLEPGQATEFSRELVADKPGEYQLGLTARGADGTEAAASRSVLVVAPKLTASVTGPATLLVGRKGTYTLTVKNAGDLAVDGATAVVTLPAGLRGTAPDGRLTFPVGELKPGEERSRTFDATAATAGVQPLTAIATASRGASATADCRTVVDGVPALRVELVDLADPVEKGQETTYEVRITNTGTKSDENVTLACELPDAISFVSATGPTGNVRPAVQGISVAGPKVYRAEFEPVRELTPKTEVVFRVKVKAVAAGDVRFKAVVTSKHLATPVVKEESTRVYGD